MRYAFLTFFLLFVTATFAQQNVVKEVSFEGLKRVDESLLARLIKVKKATLYDSLQVTTDLERLNRLPAIAKATVTRTKNSSGLYSLQYKIVENFAIIPGLRIGEANDGSFAMRASVFDFNFLGQSQIIGGFYQKDVFSSFGLYWEAPFLLSNKAGIGLNYIDNTSFEPIYEVGTIANYRKEDSGIEMYLLYEFDFHNRAELGVRRFDESFRVETPSLETTLPEFLTANKFQYRGQYELNFLALDYQYVAGSRAQIDIAYQTGGKGVLANTLIATSSVEYFKKVGTKGNWANRGQLGYSTLNTTPFAPFTIDNQLNLRGAGNDSDRGVAFTFINTEYRHTVLEKDWFVLQANSFVDMGSIVKPKGSSEIITSRTSFELYTGIGFRALHKRIFNAVLRLDYGLGLGASKNRGFVFGIGQYF